MNDNIFVFLLKLKIKRFFFHLYPLIWLTGDLVPGNLITYFFEFTKFKLISLPPTNCSTLDPALSRPGRLDRKIEMGLPDLEGRAHIFRIHTKSMSIEKDIRWDLLSRLCPNSTGAELRSVCTEAGLYAIRARRKMATESDFLAAVNKVIKSYAKFSATPKYMTYN